MSGSKQTYLIVGISDARAFVQIRGEKGNVADVEYFDVDQYKNPLTVLFQRLKQDKNIIGVCVDLLVVQNWFIKTPSGFWVDSIAKLGIPVVLSNDEVMAAGFSLHDLCDA